MFVKAPYRGARHGVATHERLVAAHRFYEKNGFAASGEASCPRRSPSRRWARFSTAWIS